MSLSTAAQYLTNHLMPAVALGLLAVLALALAYLAARQALQAAGRGVRAATAPLRAAVGRGEAADLLTYLAASIATGVAAQGMWRFFGDVLHFEVGLRAGMFAFIEIAVITSAVRARRSMKEHHSVGIDGAAVWALTSLSAVLSSMDARSFPEAVFRLAAPLVAAWLWERGMAGERRRLTGRTRIHWRLTPERILVRLGLAEATDRSAGEVNVERRLTQLALFAARARTAKGWRRWWARRRLDAAMRHAVRDTSLAGDAGQQQHLLSHLAALTNTETLLTLEAPAPWARALTGASALALPEVAPGALVDVLSLAAGPTNPVLSAAPAGGTQTALSFEGPALPSDPWLSAVPTPLPPDDPSSQAPEAAPKTDAEILDYLRQLPELPSIRALIKSHHLRFSRAQKLINTSSAERHQDPSPPPIKIINPHLQNPQPEDHLEHTPMQPS